MSAGQSRADITDERRGKAAAAASPGVPEQQPARLVATLPLLWNLLVRAGIRPLHLAIASGVSIGVALLEAISVSLLVPLLHGVIAGDFHFAARYPFVGDISRWSAARFGVSQDSSLLFVLTAVTFIASAAHIGLEAASSAMAIRHARAIAHQLRVLIFDRYLSFGHWFFARANVGHLTTVLTTLTARVATELRNVNQNITDSLVLLAYFAVMFWISWPVTLAVLVLLPLALLAGSRLVESIARSSMQDMAASKRLARHAFNVLSCIELVKAQSREPHELREFTVSSEALAQHEVQLELRRRLVGQGQQLMVLSVLLLLVVTTGVLAVRGHARVVAGSLVYVYLLRRVSTRFGVVNQLRASVAAMAGPVAEIASILQESGHQPRTEGARPFAGLQEAIKFENVSFAYTEGVPVLRHVSFSVPRGATTALVGRTGAGKTTLVRLLLRFYDQDDGAITVDGLDLREFRSESLRGHIALVSQDTLMLHATIRENLTYGLDNVSPAALADALERSRLADFVRRLPDGLDTQVGDRGTALSGGERQRIAIARAMLKRAEILVLDEATSALDGVTEQAIQDAIAELLHGTTSIVIAHRPSTIQRADHVVILDGGQVVEQGRPADLLRGHSILSEYWKDGTISLGGLRTASADHGT